ncbi:hypothetical protein L1987_85807 [Smallanthus sonchifolius]|uniref:Uncharacterized protein n=1 Tax=Smallanthus sonchifolius TaxID=185202 RepID=A0ACB8XYM0_9ASTR|nr:hypothetical protein L1987_85807 [Smallanthus sonchifolius]
MNHKSGVRIWCTGFRVSSSGLGSVQLFLSGVITAGMGGLVSLCFSREGGYWVGTLCTLSTTNKRDSSEAKQARRGLSLGLDWVWLLWQIWWAKVWQGAQMVHVPATIRTHQVGWDFWEMKKQPDYTWKQGVDGSKALHGKRCMKEIPYAWLYVPVAWSQHTKERGIIKKQDKVMKQTGHRPGLEGSQDGAQVEQEAY